MNHPHTLANTDQSNATDPKPSDLSDDLPDAQISMWSLDKLHRYVANTLEVEQDDIEIEDNLLEWGMNSLALMRLTTQLNKEGIEIGLDELLAEPTLVQWLRLIANKQTKASQTGAVVQAVDVAPIEDTFAAFPLTDVQLAYWLGRNSFFELGGVGAHGYIEVKAEGICPERLAEALNQTIAANPMLRAVVNDDGEQRVLTEVPDYDLILYKGADRSVESIRESMEHEVISADTWPLFNICLSEQEADNYLIHISFDILIFDLKSLELWVFKWWEFYRNPAAIPASSVFGFQDYVAQQSQQSAAAHESRKYWEDRVPHLPLGPTVPLVKSTETLVPKFARVQQVIPKATWDLLQKKVQQSGAMPSSLLLAAYAKILATWGETQHFCLTMTLFNRDMTGLALDQVIGDFTSLFVLEADARESQGFMQFVKKLQRQMLQDLNHKVVSGVEVLGKMAEHHKTPNKAMLPFVFTSTLGTGRSYLDAFSHFGEITKAAVQTPQVLIDHQTLEHEGNLVLNWDYVQDVFPQGLVEEMAQSHRRLLTLLAESEEAWHDPYLSLLSKEQREARKKYNETEIAFADTSDLLHEPFLRQAKQNPSAIAVVNNGREISYEALDRASNIIAAELLSLGVGSGKIAAVVMDKGWQQIVSILSILKSGAAYIPIDASQPLKRIEVLLDESDANVVLLEAGSAIESVIESVIEIQQQSAESPFNQPKILVDQSLLQQPFTGSSQAFNQAKGDDLAYVIFTSGSTGKPKGVMLSHRAALNTVLDVNQRYEVTADDSCLMVSSLSFDLSVYDIFGLLGVGGKVVIPASSALPEPSDWLKLVIQNQVTVWNSAPALFQIFYDHLKDVSSTDVISAMNTIMLSADWLNVACCAELREKFPGVRLVSMGGATEAAIWSIGYDIKSVDPKWPSIPYGEAMANQRLYVLNKQLQNTPDWVPGELYIAGVGLAEGYWEDPIKTQAAFIVHPQTAERLYRTGDWARMQPSGVIELLGRQDNQVKINGVRVELGEIEVCLAEMDSIEQAIVVARRSESQGDQLVAFVVSEVAQHSGQQGAELEKIEGWITDRLPQTLVPKVIKFLPSLPLSSNGKVDRSALVEQAQATLNQVVDNRVFATTDLQVTLTEIWGELLSRQVQDVSSNFFALGGSSLLATRLAGKINAAFNTNIAVIKIFEHSSIAGQAALIEAQLNKLSGDVSDSISSDAGLNSPANKRGRRNSGSKRKAARQQVMES